MGLQIVAHDLATEQQQGGLYLLNVTLTRFSYQIYNLIQKKTLDLYILFLKETVF